MQKVVNKNEKLPKLISVFVDLKRNSFTTKSFSNGINKIMLITTITVFILGLKVFASSQNPIVKKII